MTALAPLTSMEKMATPVLRMADLRVSFPGGVQAVRGVSLDVAPGEIVALVGESGSGKTALGLAVLGLLPASATVTGSAVLGSVDMVTADDDARRRTRRASAGAVFQDPMTSLNPSMRVGRQVAEAAGSDDDAVELLDRAGVPEPARRARQYPHELSGGLRQRVMIAMAVAGGPSLVVADEPTTALDVTVQSEIIRLFADLRADIGMSVIFITHDLGVAGQLADRIVVLYGGRVAEEGDADDVLRRSSHPYTAALLAARLDLSSRRGVPLATLPGEPPDPRQPEPGCAFAPRCRLTEPDCESVLPELAPAPAHSGRAACLRAGSVDVAGSAVAGPGPVPVVAPGAAIGLAVPALRLDGLAKGFGRRRNRRDVVRGLSLSVPAGGSVALVGESGCGKTTTLRMAVGLDRPDSGRVELGAGGPPQMVFQDAGASLTPWLRVGELLEERLRGDGVPAAERRRRTIETLALVGLPEEMAERRPRELSGGQRQRVALARAVVVPPGLLACDEPVSALDVSLAAVVLNLLARLRAELGMALLFVTHDLAAARVVADQVAVMLDGRIVEHGDADQVLGQPEHPYTRALLDAVPSLGRR